MRMGKLYATENKDNVLLDIKLFTEINGNQKVLEKVGQAYNKANKNLSYFFIIHDENNTYCVLEIRDSLKCKEIQAETFMKQVMGSVEGHSGGGKNKAFGSAEKDKGTAIKQAAEEVIKKYL